MRRMDVVQFNYVDRYPSLRPREWSRWYPSAIMVGYSALSPPPPVIAFRVRHDAGALGLLGNCIQRSSQVRYRQGWA